MIKDDIRSRRHWRCTCLWCWWGQGWPPSCRARGSRIPPLPRRQYPAAGTPARQSGLRHLRKRRGIILSEDIPMSVVFRNIDPPPPHRPGRVCTTYEPPPPPAFGAGGGHTRWVERGCGVNSSEDARHCSVFYICQYFEGVSIECWRNITINEDEVYCFAPMFIYTFCSKICCQFQSHNSPGFDPSIRRHSGIWGRADEAMLKKVHTKISPCLGKMEWIATGRLFINFVWIAEPRKFSHWTGSFKSPLYMILVSKRYLTIM